MLPWPAVCSSRIIVFPRGRAFSTSVSALEISESACSVGAASRAPGCSTTPSKPSASARSTSSPSAAIDCARNASLVVARLIR